MNAPEPSDRAAASGLPAQRPTWLVLLASLMAMASFQNLGEGLDELAGRGRVAPPAVVGEAVPASRDVAMRQAWALAEQRAIDQVPPSPWRLVVLLKLAYAGLLLLAVAAVATRDRRGRAAALTAAWAGIAHHLCRLVLFMVLVRPRMLASAPDWLPQLQAASGPSLDAATASLMLPLSLAGFGILFCTLVLVCFGGRRGKSYYGLGAVRPVGAARTGA